MNGEAPTAAPPPQGWSRRRVVAAGAAASATVVLASSWLGEARAQYAVANEVRAEMRPLAPGVFAYVQTVPPGQSDFAVANCGLIAGRNGAIAIDATASPFQAKRFVAAALRATGKPIRRVVLTHSMAIMSTAWRCLARST